jgi:hypothetical protein
MKDSSLSILSSFNTVNTIIDNKMPPNPDNNKKRSFQEITADTEVSVTIGETSKRLFLGDVVREIVKDEIQGDEEKEGFIEPFIDPKNARESVYPIMYEDIWQCYKHHQSLFWVADEIDLTKDIKDWKTRLTDDERYYIKMILAFFAGSDFIV